MTSALLALLLVSASFSFAAQPVPTKTVQPNQRYGHGSPPGGGQGCSCYYGPPFPFFKPPFGPLPPNTPGGGGGRVFPPWVWPPFNTPPPGPPNTPTSPGGGGGFPPWVRPPFVMPPPVPPTGGRGCVGVPICASKNMTCPAECYKYSPDGRSYSYACNYDCSACTITCA